MSQRSQKSKQRPMGDQVFDLPFSNHPAVQQHPMSISDQDFDLTHTNHPAVQQLSDNTPLELHIAIGSHSKYVANHIGSPGRDQSVLNHIKCEDHDTITLQVDSSAGNMDYIDTPLPNITDA